MTRQLVLAAAIVLPGLLAAVPASAGFVNNRETFDGTTFDTDTWRANADLSDPNQTTFTQDGALTIDDDIFPNARYSTIARLVAVGGGGVRADVTHLRPNGGALRLANGQTGDPTVLLDLNPFENNGLHLIDALNGRLNQDASGGPLILPGGEEGEYFLQPFGQTLTYEIVLLTNTRARYSVYDPASGVLLGRRTDDLEVAVPDTMRIVLESGNGAARFDNVELIPSPIPLPAAVWAGGAMLAALAAKRSLRRCR